MLSKFLKAIYKMLDLFLKYLQKLANLSLIIVICWPIWLFAEVNKLRTKVIYIQ